MAVYITNTPTGPRLVTAKTPVLAISHAMGTDGYTAEALNATELADWLAKGLKIETAPEPVARAKKEVHPAGASPFYNAPGSEQAA